MRLPRLARTWLRPVTAPIRGALERRVAAMVDARVSVLAGQRAQEPAHASLPVGQPIRELQTRPFCLVDEQSHPNPNELWVVLRDLDNAKLTIKFFGYELGRALAEALPPVAGLAPRYVGLQSKCSTQADLETDWAAYWMGELKSARIFHRKLWEFAYVLQAVYEHGHLHPGARGLGFGCGEEPLPSYFASRGLDVTVTDLDPGDAAARGWIDTNQHTSSRDMVYQKHLVSRDEFDRHISLRHVDMNAIPADLRGYDFCWSICALEHIGTIRKGLDFVENSLETLRPGGVAIHTTEFNFLNDAYTIDDWPTVLFQKQHFRELAERLERKGYQVAALDFDPGHKPLDKFIDIPPYQYNWTAYQREIWESDIQHLKVTIDGFACTCFGVIIRRP
jgi:2-polyprenyl-3-methyl-5-hydroxy-6-metoxy-1,4-benzoquinol methylase